MREKAIAFAAEKHLGQTRKDGVTPYVTHTTGVAGIVEAHGGDENQIIVAHLHDTVEDCDCTVEEIREHFGDDIADGVRALTNTSKADAPDLNRAARKALDNTRLVMIDDRYKMVKLADILYNVNDTAALDRGFAIKFLGEKEVQAAVVQDGSAVLYRKIVAAIARKRKEFGVK